MWSAAPFLERRSAEVILTAGPCESSNASVLANWSDHCLPSGYPRCVCGATAARNCRSRCLRCCHLAQHVGLRDGEGRDGRRRGVPGWRVGRGRPPVGRWQPRREPAMPRWLDLQSLRSCDCCRRWARPPGLAPPPRVQVPRLTRFADRNWRSHARHVRSGSSRHHPHGREPLWVRWTGRGGRRMVESRMRNRSGLHETLRRTCQCGGTYSGGRGLSCSNKFEARSLARDRCTQSPGRATCGPARIPDRRCGRICRAFYRRGHVLGFVGWRGCSRVCPSGPRRVDARARERLDPFTQQACRAQSVALPDPRGGPAIAGTVRLFASGVRPVSVSGRRCGPACQRSARRLAMGCKLDGSEAVVQGEYLMAENKVPKRNTTFRSCSPSSVLPECSRASHACPTRRPGTLQGWRLTSDSIGKCFRRRHRRRAEWSSRSTRPQSTWRFT